MQDFKFVTELYEQILLSLLFVSVPHNYNEWLQRGGAVAIPYHVRRTEQFIRENLCSALTLKETVQASGTGVRALHQGFRKFRRTTPMLFLKECRLQHAKTLPRDRYAVRRSIAEIAQEAGFDHPSKFSQAYKLRFGKLPSDTRRQILSSERPFSDRSCCDAGFTDRPAIRRAVALCR